MECRPLEISLISAKDIKNVNRFTTMGVYSFIFVSGDPRSRQKSPTDKYGGTSPKWNYSVYLTVDESDLQKGNLTLVFQLRSERPLGDRDIGEVHIPLKELLLLHEQTFQNQKEKEHQVVTYHLKTKAGKQKGTLDFSYSFGEKFTTGINPPPSSFSKTIDPPTAYPIPPPYEYQYQIPPQQAMPPEKTGGEGGGGAKFGLGFGAGILGFGGLFVASNVAEDKACEYDDALANPMDFSN